MPITPVRRGSRASRSRPFRIPRLELLEDRTLPSSGSLIPGGLTTIANAPPPRLVISSPAPGSTADQNLTVTGVVTPTELRVGRVQAEVDSGPRFAVSFNAHGVFSFQTSLALDGSADGTHVVHVWASDTFGHTTSDKVSFTLDTNLVNEDVTNDPGVQQMPSVAVDPRNGNHIVMAYLDYSLLTSGYAGIGVAVSEDNGTTWTHTAIPLPANFNQGAATPTVQFNAQGEVFVSFAAATFLGQLPPITDPNSGAPRALGFTSNNGTFVARSDDGGLTWNTPVAVESQLYDGTNAVYFDIKPDLAIDTFATMPNGQTNFYYGSLYVCWSRYYPAGQFPGEPTAIGGSDIMIAVSRDGGQTWQTQLQPQIGTGIPSTVLTIVGPEGAGNAGDGNDGLTQAAGTGEGNYSQLTIGPEGDIYVFEGPGGTTVYHSTDGGKSFTQPYAMGLPTGAYQPFGLFAFTIPNTTLTNDRFRTLKINDIAADPARPGYVYAVVTSAVNSSNGTLLDPGDIFFARSTNYGVTWQTMFQVGPYTDATVLNDDNDGKSANGGLDVVVDGQAMPQLAVDAQGDIGVIWYDTRRDPADTLLDVYGTISTDGGQTFSANFRVTDQSFNPNAGAFTDATGQTDYYLGDRIGLAMANGTAYAAWTDTRNRNQDIEFTRYSIKPSPAPPTNRFGPNNTLFLATDLGLVVTRALPKLAIAAGEEEWFQLQAAATGNLTVSADLAAPGNTVRLDLYNANGTALLETGTAERNAKGQVTGQTLTFPGHSSQTYLVLVLPGPASVAATPAIYTLDLQSLTANLGTQVYGVESGSLASGQEAYYALTVPAGGSLQVTLTPGANAKGKFHMQLLNPSTFSVLASGQAIGKTAQASLALSLGRAVYVQVFGDAGSKGNYSLQIINFDQYTTPDNDTLFFPAGGNPSQMAVADLTGNGKPDIVVDYADENFVSVLLNNGNGTFQAPRDYPVGAFQAGNSSTLQGLPDDKREMVIADFTNNGIPDIAVLNYESATISLLIGRGDGTFEPQRIIATIGSPFALAAGDLTSDGNTDLVVVGSSAGPSEGEVFLGRGDGTFGPPIPFTIPSDSGFPTNTIQIADLNHDGKNDLVYEGYQTYVLLGNGDGTFEPATPIGLGNQGGLVIADLNGDGNFDVITTYPESSADFIEYALGKGDGTFGPPVMVPGIGDEPVAAAVADLGSQITLSDGSTVLGPPDGIPDLVVADNGVLQSVNNGPPEIVVLPGLVNAQGQFTGFGSPIPLAPADSPLDLMVADLNNDGIPDVVVAETNGVEVIYGQKPITSQSAQPSISPLDSQPPTDLGTVVHVLEPTLTIIPGHEEDDYTLTVPTEDAPGAGNEVLDFSGDFQALQGAGITMQVSDAAGNVLGSGDRFRISAPQGAVLTLRVFGLTDKHGNQGSGAYTLDIDVLPQVVSAQAQPLLPGATNDPGGATASLVVTLQGDRLDPTTAQNPANYTITFLGPNGNQVIPLASGQSVVYDPSTNVDVTSGTTYPTAVKQTLTFLFDQALPSGNYQIQISNVVQTAAFNADEAGELAPAKDFNGHPVVTLSAGAVTEGTQLQAAGLVQPAGALGDFAVWAHGTPFFQQLHDDLGALLDGALTQGNSDEQITTELLDQITSRFDPALGAAGQRPAQLLVLWTDPVSLDLEDPNNDRLNYNVNNNQLTNGIDNTFVSVVGNIEVVVAAVPGGSPGPNDKPNNASGSNYTLTVSDVPATARGGVVLLGQNSDQTMSLTDGLQSGTTVFTFGF